MKKMIVLTGSLFLLMSLCTVSVTAQSFKKLSIGKSGCSLYSYCEIYLFDESKSPDSSTIYMGECNNDNIIYGTICVKLLEAFEDLRVAENVLQSYMDYLKNNFKITSATGYGLGHRLQNSEQTRGIIDYWKDDQQRNWKVKGWTNGKFLTVMYAYGKKELPESRVNVFLDGFRFPEK